MKKKFNYTLFLTIFLVFIIFCFVIFKFFLPYFSYKNIKYAEDYSISDLIKSRNVVLEYVKPTEEMINKYDINEDGKITDIDIKLIQQLIVGFYDSYEVKNNSQKVIEYIIN